MRAEELLSRCVSVDLEVDPNTGRIQSFAAIRSATADTCTYSDGDVAAALRALDEYAAGTEFVLGHNVISHDLPFLGEACSSLRVLTKPPIDTLWLNPLAFPRNPYHRLVKHYKDGRLQAGNASNPEIDAGLVLTVLRNQLAELQKLARGDPDLLTALHWLATSGEKPQGFEVVFRAARDAPRPGTREAQRAIRQVLAGRACTHQVELAIPDAQQAGWSLAYALSWISVAGENSVMPPWVASNDTAITVFIHLAVEDSSSKRLAEVNGLEGDLLDRFRELAPDLEPGELSTLNLRLASQQLRDAGHVTVRPDIVEKLIRGIARDGREDAEGIASFQVRKIDRQHLSLRLQRSWQKLALTSRLRRRAATVLLASLTASAPTKARGKDVQVATTLGTLISALTSDLELAQEITDPSSLLDHALLWLHEQGVVTLGRGLTIFRPAITVRLEPGSRKFTETDFQPLHIHYDEQTIQTHIMGKNYRRDLDWGAGYHLNQSNPLLHEIDLGGSLWAFTRTPAGTYVLAMELVVRAKTKNPPGYRYGAYRLWGDLELSRYFRTDGQPDISELIRRLSVKAAAPVLGRSFQGHAAVRRLTPADHQALVEYARHLPLEPRARLLPEEELEARILLGVPDAVSSLIVAEDPGIGAERRRYLFEQAPRRNPQHVKELRKLYEGMCQLCGWNPTSLYRRDLCEAHHVHWLSRGGHDALHNMVLICPNHHRAIHRTDAPFDWADGSFVFPKTRETVQISRHSLQAQ